MVFRLFLSFSFSDFYALVLTDPAKQSKDFKECMQSKVNIEGFSERMLYFKDILYFLAKISVVSLKNEFRVMILKSNNIMLTE